MKTETGLRLLDRVFRKMMSRFRVNPFAASR